MTRGQATLLVVEDEALIAAEIEASAEDAGYRAMVVPDIARAQRALIGSPIAGAILDFRVTDGRTAHLARRLRIIGVPFVVVSGSPRHELAQVGIEAARIFTKPANYMDVIATLQLRFGMARAG